MKPGPTLRIFAGFAVLALVFAIKAPLAAAQTADSAAISNLLTQAQHHAMLLDDDAATLESFTRSKISWKTHAGQLEVMKEHVNNLGKLTQQLTDLRSEGSPWQQEAIDQIDPLLRQMADHLTATINHLNENQNRVHMQAFRDYVQGNYELASRTHETIRDLVAYDQAKSKAQVLEQKLELPATNESQ